MKCSPSCDVRLNLVGKTSVRPKLDICQSPAVLTFNIKNNGKLASPTFIPGNDMEVRPIFSNQWELNLRVNFTETNGVHHAKACFEDLRSGNLTCFLNGTLSGDNSSCSSNRNGQANSDFLWILLCVILITCLLFIGISVFTIMSKFNSSQKSSNSRRPSKLSIEKITVPRKSSNSISTPLSNSDSNTYLLSPNYYFDERLAVIAEVDEKDQVSETSLSHFESSNSINQRLEQEKRKLSAESANRNKQPMLAPTSAVQKATIICQKDQVILPQNLSYARRNSQPLIFPTSASLDSLQKRQQQPQFMMSFAV
ncbi:hypothetical protein M3Y97_00207200 [Aphelenchoides bicaudatus]|nr:hypothetical protein M3Y97_00207200 [Aphelenchoides bicaudatus]